MEELIRAGSLRICLTGCVSIPSSCAGIAIPSFGRDVLFFLLSSEPEDESVTRVSS